MVADHIAMSHVGGRDATSMSLGTQSGEKAASCLAWIATSDLAPHLIQSYDIPTRDYITVVFLYRDFLVGL